MSKDDLDSLHETLFWLSQPNVRRDIDAARSEVAEGRTLTTQKVRAGLGSE